VTRIPTAAELLDTVYPVAKPAEIGYVLICVAAVLLWWLCRAHPGMLPFWAPWDFSFVEFLSAWLAIGWYVRGLAAIAPEDQPSLARHIAFFVGVLLIYSVLETHFEYYAEHQFFYNRIQHVIMHHLGPLLIALAWPGETLWQGLPAPLRRIVGHPYVIRPIRVLQQPVLAAVLFSGSFFFWLVPSVHFRAMIDPNLYAAMNWTMVADGILFWCLVLDPRPCPPARASFAVRAALAFAVMFPQIIGGAIITFSKRDLYTFYNLCGRIYPQLGAGFDQAVGGLIIWIPPAMMSALAALLVLNNLRKVEEQAINEGGHHGKDAYPIISSAQWTGR
jgi:putative membrane protein